MADNPNQVIEIAAADHSADRPTVKRGRPSLESKVLADTNYLVARGYSPLTAAMVLEHVVDEGKVWKRLINSQDDRVVLQTLQFLVSMRDGKPAQRINVTSTNLTLTSSDLAQARAIVAEIRGDVNQPHSPLQVDEAQRESYNTEVRSYNADVTVGGGLSPHPSLGNTDVNLLKAEELDPNVSHAEIQPNAAGRRGEQKEGNG